MCISETIRVEHRDADEAAEDLDALGELLKCLVVWKVPHEILSPPGPPRIDTDSGDYPDE